MVYSDIPSGAKILSMPDFTDIPKGSKVISMPEAEVPLRDYPPEEKARRFSEFKKQALGLLPLAASVAPVPAIQGPKWVGVAARYGIPALYGAGGELARQALEKEPVQPGKALGEGATSAVGMGVFDVAGTAALKGLGALTGLGAGTMGKIYRQGIKPKYGIPLFYNRKIGQIAEGIKKGEETIMKTAGKELGQIKEAMKNEVFDSASASRIVDDFTKNIEKEAKTAVTKFPAEIDNITEKLKLAEQGKLTKFEMDEVRDNIDKLVRWGKREKGVEFSGAEKLFTRLRNDIKEKIDFPGYKEALQKYSDAADVTEIVAPKSADQLRTVLKGWETLGPETKKALLALNMNMPKNRKFLRDTLSTNLSKKAMSAFSYQPIVRGAGSVGLGGMAAYNLLQGNIPGAMVAGAPLLLGAPALASSLVSMAGKPVSQLALRLGAQALTRGIRDIQ